ncbi:hypothetical protein U1Q18_006904, partial [Sarracenia purpurea var. burkii]
MDGKYSIATILGNVSNQIEIFHFKRDRERREECWRRKRQESIDEKDDDDDDQDEIVLGFLV